MDTYARLNDGILNVIKEEVEDEKVVNYILTVVIFVSIGAKIDILS